MSLLVTTSPLILTLGTIVLSLLLLAIAYPDRYILTRPLPSLPGPRGLPILGNVLHVLPWTGRTLEWLGMLIARYGDVCTFTLPRWGRGILINRPEWLAHIKQRECPWSLIFVIVSDLGADMRVLDDMQRYARGPKEVAIFSEFPGRKTPVASDEPV